MFKQVETNYAAVSSDFSGQMVSVTVDGQTVSGTASGGQPLLLAINGARFSPLAALAGNAILFKAQSSSQLLATLAGKKWKIVTPV